LIRQRKRNKKVATGEAKVKKQKHRGGVFKKRNGSEVGRDSKKTRVHVAFQGGPEKNRRRKEIDKENREGTGVAKPNRKDTKEVTLVRGGSLKRQGTAV